MNKGYGMMNSLVKYSVQLAMLKNLLNSKLISEEEHERIKAKLKYDYKVVSDIAS